MRIYNLNKSLTNVCKLKTLQLKSTEIYKQISIYMIHPFH